MDYPVRKASPRDRDTACGRECLLACLCFWALNSAFQAMMPPSLTGFMRHFFMLPFPFPSGFQCSGICFPLLYASGPLSGGLGGQFLELVGMDFAHLLALEQLC